MSLARIIARNVLKKEQGNNKINEEFRKFQVYKYGVGPYIEMRDATRPKTKSNKNGKIKINKRGSRIILENVYLV